MTAGIGEVVADPAAAVVRAERRRPRPFPAGMAARAFNRT
jgi:hypothetical protein